METTTMTAAEAAEYGEFKRTRREAEISAAIKRLVIDASRRETDRYALKTACESAKKLGARAVLVSPVNVTQARKYLARSGVEVFCLAGGTGESLPAIKKTEIKKAVAQGASEIRFVPCYSALTGGNLSYLKKELRKGRKAVKRGVLMLSLEDRTLGEAEIALGVRAARDGKADGVCVRGELDLLARAMEASAGKLRVDVSGVENCEQLKGLLRAGAMCAVSGCGEKVAEELYQKADEEASAFSAALPVLPVTPV